MNHEQTKRIILDVHSANENLKDFIKISIFDYKIDKQTGAEILRIFNENQEKLLKSF